MQATSIHGSRQRADRKRTLRREQSSQRMPPAVRGERMLAVHLTTRRTEQMQAGGTEAPATRAAAMAAAAGVEVVTAAVAAMAEGGSRWDSGGGR